VWTILFNLADHTPSGFPIFAFYVFSYETGLRPSTLYKLRWDDWEGTMLHIRPETDKARYGRMLPLSLLAQECLAALHSEAATTVIFPQHDLRKHWLAAATKGGIPKAAPYDLRHARATHLLDRGASLSATAYLLGHRQMTTTNTYAHGTLQQAAQVVLGANWEHAAKQTGPSVVPSPVFTRRGERIRTSDPQTPRVAQDHEPLELTGDRQFVEGRALQPLRYVSERFGRVRPKREPWFTMAAAWLATRVPEVVEAWQ
jgi:hypothetical protein